MIGQKATVAVPMVGMEIGQMVGDLSVVPTAGAEGMVIQKEIAAVQMIGMEIEQRIEEVKVVPATGKEGRVVQTEGAEVKMAHQKVELVAVLQEVQVVDHLYGTQVIVIIVEAGVRAPLQKAAVVLPETEGELAERKVVLLQVAGGIPANYSKKNRAPALFFLFINF